MKQISIIRYIVKYSFIIYLFDVIDVNIVLYKLMMYLVNDTIISQHQASSHAASASEFGTRLLAICGVENKSSNVRKGLVRHKCGHEVNTCLA
jgi:hypothetical protein